MNKPDLSKTTEHPRWGAFGKLVKEVHKGGWVTAADLETRTKLKHSTIRHDLKLGVYIGVFKQTHVKGSYAWIDYEDAEEEARNWAKHIFLFYVLQIKAYVKSGDKALRPPKLNDYLNTVAVDIFAVKLGKPPSDPNVANTVYKAFHHILDHREKHFSPEQCKEIEQILNSANNLMLKSTM